MRTLKHFLTCLTLLLFSSSFLRAQDLSPEQWKKLIEILRTDDTVALSQDWASFSNNTKEVIMVSIITGKPNVFNWTVKHKGSGIPISEFNDGLSISLLGGFLEVPKAAAELGWDVGPEVWNGVIQCNYPLYILLLSLFNEELPALMPESRPAQDYIDIAQWLLDLQVPFDYAVIEANILEASSCAMGILKYLLDKQPPPDELGSKDNWLLFLAIQSESADSVRRMLIAGDADPNFVLADRSMLWYSVKRNEPAVTRYLLQFGADPLWLNSDSSLSSLSEAVMQGQAAIVQELLPFIPSVNYRHRNNNTVLHYLADYSHHDIHDTNNRCSLTGDSAHNFTAGHFTVLKMLKDAGMDFNLENNCGNLAFERLAKTTDTNWISIVQLFVENVNHQSSLSALASSFSTISNKKEEKLFRTIIGKLQNIGWLLYTYLPEEGVTSPEKDNLMRQLIFYAAKLPSASEFSYVLRRYALNKSTDMVRYILYDVTRKYATLYPGINVDSLKSVMVNQQQERCRTTIIQDLLAEGSTDSATIKIMRELMLCRPSLFNRNTCNYLTAFDQLIGNVDFQKAFGPALMTYILQQQMLDINRSNATVINPETGDRLRRDLAAYRQDRNWLRNNSYCFDAMLRGDGLIINGANIQVNVAGYGRQNTGNWPKRGCDSIIVSHFMNNTPENLAYVYHFNADRNLRRDRFRSVDFTGAWPRRFDEGSYDFYGASGLEDITLTGTARLVIPRSVFSDGNHNTLPTIELENGSPSLLSVEQGTNQFIMKPSTDTILDRSLGEINISYSMKDKNIRFEVTVLANLNYTSFENLVVPDGNNIPDRLKVYLEIARLNSYLSKPDLVNVEKKNMIVTIHLLSEYAMQRDYLSRIKEDYKRVNDQISAMEEALTNLNNFYRNFATLTWENLPTLIRQLELAIASPRTPPEEKARYQSYLDQLKKAQSLAELAKIYNELFNDKFNQIIDKAVSEYQLLTLELAQYPVQSVLPASSNRDLLMQSPVEFRKLANKSVEKKKTPVQKKTPVKKKAPVQKTTSVPKKNSR